jgi:hypothetical protein
MKEVYFKDAVEFTSVYPVTIILIDPLEDLCSRYQRDLHIHKARDDAAMVMFTMVLSHSGFDVKLHSTDNYKDLHRFDSIKSFGITVIEGGQIANSGVGNPSSMKFNYDNIPSATNVLYCTRAYRQKNKMWNPHTGGRMSDSK